MRVGSIATATESGSWSENWSLPSRENANAPTSRSRRAGGGSDEATFDGVPIVSRKRDLLGHVESDHGQRRKRRA